MRVKCLFFAVYQDLMGKAEHELELPEGTTLERLIERLRADGAAALPDSVVVAVNQEYAASDTVLRDGDEVALIPPVAGG